MENIRSQSGLSRKTPETTGTRSFYPLRADYVEHSFLNLSQNLKESKSWKKTWVVVDEAHTDKDWVGDACLNFLTIFPPAMVKHLIAGLQVFLDH